MSLSSENCLPPEGLSALTAAEAAALAPEVPGWTSADQTLTREFTWPSFPEAVAFVNRVAEVAQAQDHHPDICISYRKVRLTFTTHKLGGLSRNDFIMAAKVESLSDK
jgi:4a-hydroxytetrahydrobiopterin dehydratase